MVIYSSYKICPRGESSKKVFLPSGCWPFKGSPPIPNPIHSAFRDFFWRSVDPRYWFYVLVIVNFLLESPILPYYCCYVGVWTKCQPDKMPTGHNANQRLAFCLDLFLWLAFCPSQLFGWHFVRTISTCFGILAESWKSQFPPLNVSEAAGGVC